MLIIRIRLLKFILLNLEINDKINVICFMDKCYPHILFKIDNPPLVIFYVGEISGLNSELVTLTDLKQLNYYQRKVANIILKNKFLLTYEQNINYQFTQIARCVIIYCDYKHLINKGRLASAFSFGYELSDLDKVSLVASLINSCYVLTSNGNELDYHLVNNALDNGACVYALAGSIFDAASSFSNLLIDEGAQIITYHNVKNI